jgi:ketosteroid isomerase-like protein
MNVQTVAEAAEIRKLVDAQKKAMHEKNSAAAVAHFAPDAVVFDLAPSLRSVYGANAGKVQEWMDGWEGPIETETRELKVTISGDLAYWYGYSRITGHPKRARRM